MELRIKSGYVILLIIALLGLSFLLGRVNGRREVESLSNALSEAQNQIKDTVYHYAITVDGLKMQIWEQKQVILSQKDAINAEILDKEKLRKLYIRQVESNTVIKGTLKAVRDSIANIKPEVIIVKDTSGMPHPYLRLPFQESYSDDYLNLSFNINEDASWGFGVDFALDLDITAGWVKTGFLKTEPRVFATTNSPYVNIVNIQGVKIENPVWYDKPWIRGVGYALSFSAGYFLGGR
ncbi:MAG: hypothetical protein WC961_07140 [Anaerovoracaceae bacterium]